MNWLWTSALRAMAACLPALAIALLAGCGESRRPPQKTPNVPKVAASQPATSAPPAQAGTSDIAAPPTQPSEAPAEEEETPPKPLPPPPEVEGLKRLGPEVDVWLDAKNKRVVMVGEICRREGQLEMFACLKNSKEHESIVAIKTQAFIVNAALIALGANPGQPVRFRPEFKPASGPEVEVTVHWTDAEGKRRQVRAQEWIRHIKTGKAMEHPWVFAGSGFWIDQNTGEQHFMAEDGDLICVSNFTTAMLDLPVESSQASSDLQFEAFTERIPPPKTQVVVMLTPKIEAAEAKKEPKPQGEVQ
jgi:hypothetical protein